MGLEDVGFTCSPGDSAASPVWESLDYMTCKFSSSSNILGFLKEKHPSLKCKTPEITLYSLQMNTTCHLCYTGY